MATSIKNDKIFQEIAMTSLRLNSKFPLDKSQPIFMGIDVHKRTLSVSFMHQSVIVGQFSIPNDNLAIKGLLERYRDFQVFSVYEAGFSGFNLHFFLQSLGVKNIIISPNKLPTISGDRVKTDTKDSKKLALFLQKNLLKSIDIPTKEELDKRQYLRTRTQLVKKKVSVCNQIKLLLLQDNLPVPTTGLNNKTILEILSLDLSTGVRCSIKIQIDLYKFLCLKIKELEEQALGSMSEADEKILKLLQTAPGVGTVTGLTLLWEIRNWNRFKNKKQICAYVGLTPSEYSSGEHIKKGRITGQGNSQIRSLLVEVSWILVRSDPAMEIVFKRLVANTGSKKKAIVGIARRLIQRLHAMIIKNEPYQLGLIY